MINTRYKNYSIKIQDRDFEVLQGNHILALGFSDDPLASARKLIDRDFETDLLQVIRAIPPMRRI